MPSAVVHVQALDGTWERIGTGRSVGITVENVQLSANEWGPDTASFTLRRDPGAVYPDLLAFTPMYVTAHGVKVWSGRIHETPTRDGAERSISVQGRGWQYHLDDDPYWPFLAHTRLTDWRDIRSHLSADLSADTTSANVEAGEGGITITFAANKGSQADRAQVFFDAGPGRKIKRVVIQWECSAAAANRAIYFALGDSVAELDDFGHQTTIYGGTAASSGTFSYTISTATRFVAIRVDTNSHDPSADEWLKVTSAKLFADTAYESGGASVLTVDELLLDALGSIPNLLSTDTSGIETQTFALPEYAPGDYRTIRQMAEVVRQLEDAVVKVDVDKRLILKDKPQRPRFRVGRWSGADFSDQSAGSAESIYNRVLVTGTGPDGEGLTVGREAGVLDGADSIALSTPSVDNPSFATNTTGWTAGGGSAITRDTGVYDSSPASGKWDSVYINGVSLEAAITGTFEMGRTYLLTLKLRRTILLTDGALALDVSLGPSTDRTTQSFNLMDLPHLTWTTVRVAWTPSADSTAAVLRLSIRYTTPVIIYSMSYDRAIYVDSLSPIYHAIPTLPDRHGFRRTAQLPVSSGLIEELGQQLADTFLGNHMSTPFKGELDVAPGGVRENGRTVHPSELLINTSEQVLFTHLIDPDTGAVGRSGRIVNMSYDDDTEHGKVSIDNESGRFTALLERLAVING